MLIIKGLPLFVPTCRACISYAELVMLTKTNITSFFHSQIILTVLFKPQNKYTPAKPKCKFTTSRDMYENVACHLTALSIGTAAAKSLALGRALHQNTRGGRASSAGRRHASGKWGGSRAHACMQAENRGGRAHTCMQAENRWGAERPT